MQAPSISTSHALTEHDLYLKRKQEDWYASTRSVAMYCLTLFFVSVACVLFTLSLFPQSTLPFSGVYFVIGIFLFFIALGILLVNFACQLTHLFRRTRITEFPTTSTSHIHKDVILNQPHQA